MRILVPSGLLAVVLAASAFAQATPPDYGAAATAFKDGLIPIVTTVLPIAVALMAVIWGPRLLKRLISTFAR